MEWISVKDRLPKHGQQVLTYSMESEDSYSVQRIVIFGSTARGFTSAITHWMPLPEPPKE